jgi:hypothetical protein
MVEARFFLPRQRTVTLRERHSGSEARSISSYFFLGPIE